MNTLRRRQAYIGTIALNMISVAFALKTYVTHLEPGWVQGTLYLATFVCDVAAIIYVMTHPERD